MITIFRYIKALIFDEPCPYWNFFTRTCMSRGHSLGFENTEYCKHSDAIIQCLHYPKGRNNKIEESGKVV